MSDTPNVTAQETTSTTSQAKGTVEAVGQPVAQANTCCSVQEQSVCCEPQEKSACCGSSTDSCGC